MDLTILHQLVQEVIDAIGTKQPAKAKKKIESAFDLLNQMMDTTASDSTLISLSKYETLLKVLHNKLK
ncbi:MAG TPA: hypothetical protein VKY82_03485 [Flavobacterium sp.]|nr:hypothetical protein [Flavobacterium sp.]